MGSIVKVEPRGFTDGVDGAGMGKGSQRCAQLTGLSIWMIELAFVELEKTVEEGPLCVFSCQPPGGQGPAPFRFFAMPSGDAWIGALGGGRMWKKKVRTTIHVSFKKCPPVVP